MTLPKLYSLTRFAVAALAMSMAGCPGDDVTTPGDGTDSEATGDSSTGGSVSMTSQTNATTMVDSSGGTTDATTGSMTDSTDSGMDTTVGSSDGGPSACGNNVLEGAEECDLTQLGGETCETQGFDDGTLACNVDCTLNTDGCGTCGDDMAAAAEACDGTDLLGETCVTQGFVGGFLGCAADCSAYDTSMCSDMATCGNDLTEVGETCDGTDLGGEDCVSQGFAGGGTLGCAADCLGYDLSMCMGMGGDCCTPNGTPGCENAICEATICAADGFCCSNTWDQICADAAIGNPDCVGVSASCPTGMEVCGNDLTEIGETCDGTDLGGQDCILLGFAGGGTLACDVSCGAFDTSMCDAGGGACCAGNGTPGCDEQACEAAVCALDPFCCDVEWEVNCANEAIAEPACVGAVGCPTGMEVCGNDLLEIGEQCDNADLAGQDCVSLGFIDGGTLACAGDCTFDTSMCDTGSCCVPNGSPGCNDAACEALICAADSFCCDTEWDQLCADAALNEPTCDGLPGCPTGMEVCGNDLAEFGEACDGTDLSGQDCIGLGFAGGGTLDCALDCTFDTSMCDAGGGDCCAPNGSPGCDDSGCETAICALDPFCCSNTWDQICADEAAMDPACAGVGGSCP